MWELFPRVVVWEVWNERNRQFFEEKNRTMEAILQLVEIHLKETLILTQWKSEVIKENNAERKLLNNWGIF